MPIGVITIIVGLLSYIIKDQHKLLDDCLIFIFFLLVVTLLFFSLAYLIMTINNVFIKYDYLYWGHANEILKYENDTISFNSHPDVEENEKIILEDIFKFHYAKYATHNNKVNERRGYNLFMCKNYLLASVIVSILLIVYSLFKII
ncbi:MAG: hypothetical protein LBE34_12560 [Flavobacteriaceae bacterium]|jgi:4-amino-4-deoxy-L-arabinose transferase-like glycosyltransferase|nr:hypothetical protein [Flavobacteriaceae bacterium]